jgi:UDP-N-acetylglucosamine 2-epimerase (non-hydrolysing)
VTDRDTSDLKRVLVVLGTRPEAIKLAPVILELQRPKSMFKTVVCATGQHREMLAQTLDSFHLRPDYNLGVMRPDQSLAEVTTAVLSGIDRVVVKEKPDVVLVQGDTTTTFAASLAAYYHRTCVGHIEAGLRTGHRYNPFPEELNRRLSTHIADFHFAPTELARENLLKEGIRDEQILISGNTVVDALYHILANLATNPPQTVVDIPEGQRLILVTAHRRESFGQHMEEICEAIRRLVESRSDVLVVFPVHLNPNVQRPVQKMLRGVSNLVLLDPLDYISFVAMMKRAYILLTDSGGMQEEGPSLRKPVLVMRSVSERPEALMAGAACLVGTSPSRIVATVSRLLDDPDYYEQMTSGVNPFGDGKAAARIVGFLAEKLFKKVPQGSPKLPERVL